MDFSPFTNAPKWGNDFPKLVGSINNQAHAARVPPCALAAIVKRESDGCNIFQIGMPHDSPDCGYGYCQITYGANRADPEHPTFAWNGKVYDLFDPSSNLYVAAEAFLGPAITDMLNLRAEVGMAAMPLELLYYVFADYNAGEGAVEKAVRAGTNVDAVDTDGYGAGVLALYHAALGDGS